MPLRPRIINVTPISAARGAAAAAAAKAEAAGGAFIPPSFGKKTKAVENEPLHTTYVDEHGRPTSDGKSHAVPAAAAGVAQTVAGVAVAAIGVPMLILPGPGVLTIGAGAAIAAGGIKKIRESK